jgi:hypothetical protein
VKGDAMIDLERLMNDVDYFPDVQIDHREEESNPRKLKIGKIVLTPHRRRQLLRYFEMGIGGRDWYKTMYQDFLDIFPSQQDADMFIKFLAATSPNNAVGTNMLYAFKAYALWLTSPPGALLPCYDETVPPNVFRGFSSGHCPNVNRAIRGEPLSGLKVSAFVNAMFGDEKAMVIDRWMIRAAGFPLKMTNRLRVEFLNGSKIEGKAYREGNRRGYLLQYDLIKKGKRAGEDPAYTVTGEAIWDEFPQIEEVDDRVIFIPSSVIASAKFKEDNLTDVEYRGLARLVTTVSKDTDASPRDFQAAVWTGIKLERDPTGIENFVYFFRQRFGESPFRSEVIEDMVKRAKFVKEEEGEDEEDVPETVSVGTAGSTEEATAIESANMLQ